MGVAPFVFYLLKIENGILDIVEDVEGGIRSRRMLRKRMTA